MNRKKRLTHGAILAGVFILAVLVFEYFTNKGNDNMTADMGAATYPQVTFSYNGYGLNTLPGYASKRDLTAIRETVTPVKDGKLDVRIEPYEAKIQRVSYTVYSLDGKEKRQKGSIESPGVKFQVKLEEEWKEQDGWLEMVFHVKGDKDVFYYTRLTPEAGKSVSESLDYIRDFHENALEKGEDQGIGTAIEPSEDADNTTFQKVTIESDFDHVTWGGLKPQVEQGERWNVKEITSSYVAVQLEYRVRCKGEENETDLYQVTEFFKVRHAAGTSNTYLLDYDREMEQVFDATRHVLNEKGIQLGITSDDISYGVNQDGSIVSFVEANELWNYNKNTDELALVFSFSSAESKDIRNLTPHHSVQILDVEEDGDTVFSVSGYMNRGEHEGETGLAVYVYDIRKNSVEEQAFLSTDTSGEAAEYELSDVFYYNRNKKLLYVISDGALYQFNLKTGGEKALAEGLKEGEWVLAREAGMAAYRSPEKGESLVIVRDLKENRFWTIEDPKGEIRYPLGFVQRDFVCGVAKEEEKGMLLSGEEILPMYKLEIQNEKEELKKTYQQEGTYVRKAVFSENMITLERVKNSGNYYVADSSDYITNNAEKKESNIQLTSYQTELKETQWRLTYENGISDKDPKFLNPKQVLYENPVVMEVGKQTEASKKEDVTPTDRYFVYGKGKLQGIFEQAGEAVLAAEKEKGLAVDSYQQVLWADGSYEAGYQVFGREADEAALVEKLQEGELPLQAAKALKGGREMDLSGCSLEQLLYLVGQNRLILAVLGEKETILMTGYGSGQIFYTDGKTGEEKTMTFEDFRQSANAMGNVSIGL